VTIIPQDPTILSGTLRSTLDVFDEYDDADIFDALKRTHLLEESSSEGDADAQSTDASVERNKNVFKDLSSPVK
jgi:ABC-type multidrug transport system fused ATPase/permease subunit